MTEKEIGDFLARPDPCTDQVNPCFSWQVKKHPTVVYKDGDYCPITNEDLYSLIKGNMTDNSHNLDISTTSHMDKSFFETDPSNDHVGLEYYCTRTYIGVTSKEFHTTAKDISMENVEQFIGQRSIESLSEVEFDNFLQEQLKEVDLSDRHIHVLRKNPETFKKCLEGDAFDGASASKAVPNYSRQDTLTRHLTGQGYVRVEPDQSPPQREKRASKISKSDLKKQSELKRSQCQPLLDKLESIQKHLKYLLTLIKNNPSEVRRSRKEYEILVNDYELLELETERIRKDWSSLPPVEGEDLMQDIDELHAVIRPQMEAINFEFDKTPPMKSGKEKTLQDIRIECQSLYDQLVQLKLLWSHYLHEQPLDSRGWQTKRKNIDKVQTDTEKLRERFESLELRANQENINSECKEYFNDFIDFYKTFHDELTIYLINFYKEEFTKFPQAGSNHDKARETKSILCQVYILRLKELQVSLELMTGSIDSPGTKKKVEELRKEMSSVKKGIDALDTEWLGVEVGHSDPVEDLSKQFDRLSHKLDETRIKIFEPPKKTKNLTKEEKALLTETKRCLFQPYLDKLHDLKAQLVETINFTVDHKNPEEIFLREKKVRKISKEVEDSRRQLEQLELKWKEVPVEDLNTEYEFENILKDITALMKTVPGTLESGFKLVAKETLPLDKVVFKEEKVQDVKVKYEELYRKLEELRKLWMDYAAQHPKDERDWQLKKKNIEKIQSDLDDLRKEFVELRTGVNVEWEVGEEDLSIQFEEMYSSLQDDYTSYLIPFVKEEFTNFPQAKPNLDKAREAKSILCHVHLVKMKELQLSLEELMRTGEAEYVETKRRMLDLMKDMTSIKKGIDALEIEWVGIEAGRLDPVEDLSKQFDQLSHKLEESRMKIFKPPQKIKNLTKEEKAAVTETKRSLFQPYLDKMHLLKQQLLETINFSSETETAEENLIRQKKIKKLSNELHLTKNQVDQINLEWSEVPVESLNFETDINAIHQDTVALLNKIPKDADGKFVIKKTVDVEMSHKPEYQHLLNKLSELYKQLNDIKGNRGDGSKKTQDKNNKKAKELEKEIESLKKRLDKKDSNWRAYKVEGFDPFSNIGSIFGDFGYEDYVSKDVKVEAGETNRPESHIKTGMVDKPHYQHLLDRLSQISFEKEALAKETHRDPRQAKQEDKKLKELEKEIEYLVRKLDRTDINWRIHPVKGFDTQSNIHLFSIFGDSPHEDNKDSPKIKEQKNDLLKKRNEEYEPLFDKLSVLQKKWSELGVEILPKKSKLKKMKETEIKEVEDEMDRIKEKLSQLDEKWRSFETGVDRDTVDPVRAVKDLFLTLQTQLITCEESEQSENKTTEHRETFYNTLIDELNEIAKEIENTVQELNLPGHNEKVLIAMKDHLKQLKDESDKIITNLEVLELEWRDNHPVDKNIPIVGPSVATTETPNLAFKRLQEKIEKSFDQVNAINNKETKMALEEEAITEKVESKMKAYEPLINKYRELEAKLLDISRPESISSEEQLQVKVEEIQKLEKEIGDVKKDMDTLDLEWRGVKVGDVDPIPSTSDLVKKFNESVQNIKLKLPKKEDIIKQKVELKKKAYEPLINKYRELEAKLLDISRPESISSEEQLQVKVEEIQKLEKEIGDVKKDMDTLDLEWRGVKVGDVDPIPSTSDLVKKFNESVQNIKLKLPKKEDIIKQKVELKKKAYEPLINKYRELEAKLLDISRPESISSEEQLQVKVEEIQKLEKEIGDVKKDMDTLDLEWRGVKVGDVDPIPITSDLVKKFNESVQNIKLKLPKKVDIIKQKVELKKKAYEPLINKYRELEAKLLDISRPESISSEEQLQVKVEEIQKLEKEIGDVKKDMDTLDLEWRGVKVGDVDPIPSTSDLVKKFNESVQNIKLKLPKKEDIIKQKVELKKKAYKPLINKYRELEAKLLDISRPESISSEEQLQVKIEEIQKLEKEIGDVKKDMDTLDLEWRGVKVGDVDPIPSTSDLVKKFNESVQNIKLKLPKKEDIIKQKVELKKKAYEPLINKYRELEAKLLDISRPESISSEEQLQVKVEEIQKLEKEIGDVKKDMDTLDLEWRGVKVGDVDPIPITSDLVKKFNESVQNIKLKLPKEDIIKQKVELKKKAYEPLINKYRELEAKLLDISRPESISSEEQLQVKVEEIQKLEKEIGDVKKDLDTLDLEWKGVKVGDVDPIPSTSDLVKKFNESVQNIKLKFPKKEDLIKRSKTNIEKANGLEKLEVYYPFLNDLKQLQLEINECGCHSHVDPVSIREKSQNIKSLENHVTAAQNSLDLLEMKWMDREAKFDPGTIDPALDAMQLLKKLKEELQAVKAQAEKSNPRVYDNKVEAYMPLKSKLNKLLERLNDLSTDEDFQKKFDALSGLSVELENVGKEISGIDEYWKDISITGVDPSLEVNKIFSILNQQLQFSLNDFNKEKDEQELSLNKEKACQPLSDDLTALKTSFDNLSKSISGRKDVKEFEDALQKAKDIEKNLESSKKMLDTLETKWKNVPSVAIDDPIGKSIKFVANLEGGLKKLINDVEGNLKNFQDEMHLAKSDFIKEAESLESIVGSTLPWEGLDNYQQMNKTFIHDQLANVQIIECDVDAGLKKLENVFSQTTQKLQDINSPLSLKEKDNVKKTFDGLYVSIGKLKKELEQKRSQLNLQLQLKNFNLEKNSPADKCFNELQNHFVMDVDSKNQTHFVETMFALENPDAWKIIEQHEKTLPKQLKSDVRESFRLLKQIEADADSPSIKSSLKDIQVIDQEKASTLSPDVHSSMNQKNKLKPSSWKFNIPRDFASKLTWLDHHLRELKEKLSSSDQSIQDQDALAKEVSSLQWGLYQASKPLTEYVNHLSMDINVGSEIDPQKMLKSLEDIKKLKTSLDAINNDLEKSLQIKFSKLSSNLYSDGSKELDGHIKKLEKDLHSMPDNEMESDINFSGTLKTKLENIEAVLKSLENGYNQHLALSFGKRSPSKLKELMADYDGIESSVDGVQKLLKFKLSSDPSFSHHLNISPNLTHIELRLKNIKNSLSEEATKSMEGDAATISSHVDEYKKLLVIAETTLKDDNLNSIDFNDPQQLEKKIHFLQNLLNELEGQMGQVELSVNQAPLSLQQNLKSDKKQLDNKAKLYIGIGHKQLNLLLIILSSWKSLLPHLKQFEQTILDKQKKAKADEASIKKLNPKELNGKLKQLTEIKRDLENDRPKLSQLLSEAWSILNVSRIPSLESRILDLQKTAEFEKQISNAISRIENEMRDRTKLDALLLDYNKLTDGASKGLVSAKKLLNKKSPTFEDVEKIQGLSQDAKKDLHEANNLKAEVDKVAQNLLSLKPDASLESKLTKLDDGLRKHLNDCTEVEEKLGYAAPLAISKSQALSKLEDWLEHAHRSLKEDDDSKKFAKDSESIKALVEKYKNFYSDLPLQKALLSILGFSISMPIDSVSSGTPRISEIDSSVDLLDEGLGESLEPSGTATPEESLECFKKFNSISKSIEDRFSSLGSLKNDVDVLENGVKELEKWIEEDAVKKYSELESDVKKLHIEHLQYQIHELKDCLKNMKKWLFDLSSVSERMSKITWPDTSAFSGKVRLAGIESRLSDLDRKLLEFNKELENKSGIVEAFNRCNDDCKNLNKTTEVHLQRLSQICNISGSKSFSTHLDDLKNLQKSYKSDSDDKIKKFADVVTQLGNVCDTATKNEVDKNLADIKLENTLLMSNINKSIDEGESLLQDIKNIDELYDGIEKFAGEKDTMDLSIPLDDARSKSINEDVQKLDGMCKQFDGMKNELIKKIDKEAGTNFFKSKTPIDSKANNVIKKLNDYLKGKHDTFKPYDLTPVLHDLEAFLSEKLEPKLSSMGREKPKSASHLKQTLEGFNLLSQDMDSLSIRLHAANESDMDGPIEASTKDKLIRLNTRWCDDRKKLSNLMTALRDRLALLQNFSERCKEWEKYLNEIQKEFSEQKQPGNFKSCLELQSKIKSFLDQVPSRHCTLHALVSDAGELSDDVPNKKSFQAKLSLLEDQWHNLINQIKKKDLAMDGFVLLWRQYENSKHDTSKAVKGLEKKLEGVINPTGLNLSSIGQVKELLEDSRETLTSIELKHFKELRLLSDQLLPISDTKTAKELHATTKDLTTQKEKLGVSLESSVDMVCSVMSGVQDLEEKIADYQKMLDSTSEETKKPLPKSYDGVNKEKTNVEKLIHNLEQDKILEDINKQKNVLVGSGMFNQSSVSLLESKVKLLKTGRNVTVDLLKNKLSRLQSYLNKWPKFDDLHVKVNQEINGLNGVIDEGEKVPRHNLKDLLEFYALDFKARLVTLQSSVDELDQTGNQLKAVSNDQFKSKIEAKVKDVQDKQKALIDKTGQKTKQLEDAYKKLNQFNDEVPKLEEWLHSVELDLCFPVTFETAQSAEIENHAKVLQTTEKEVNAKSTSFQELSKLADYLSSNQDACPTKIEARSITKVKDDLLKRWSVLQNLLPYRKHFLSDTESNWDAYKKNHAEFISWLGPTEKELQQIIPKTNKYANVKSARDDLKIFLENVQKKSSDFIKLNSMYSSLVNKLQIDEKGEMKQLNDSVNKRWNESSAKATSELRRMDNLKNIRDDFNSKAFSLEKFIKGLINNLEQAVRSKQKKVKVRTSVNAQNELKRKAKQMENFEDSAKYLLEKVDPSEKDDVSLKVDHVRDLQEKVKELLKQMDQDDNDDQLAEEVVKRDDKAGRGWFSGKSADDDEEDGEHSKLRQLEKWLDYAEGVLLKDKFRPITLQGFKEALKTFKNLDNEIQSWKPDVVKIRHSAPNLAQHTAESEKLCRRISDAGHRWDEVCLRNKAWGDSLDSILLNSDFLLENMHDLDDLLKRLTSELKKISDTPIDDSTPDLKIRQLSRDLTLVEHGLDKVKPNLATLRQLHNHACSSPGHSSLPPERDSQLNEVGKHLDELETKLGFLSDGCLEERARLNRVKGERPNFKEDEEEWGALDEMDLGPVSSPSYWKNLISRGCKTALPIQVLMLLLLGFASIVPVCDPGCFSGAIYSFNGGPPPT